MATAAFATGPGRAGDGGNSFHAVSGQVAVRGTYELAADGRPTRVQGTWFLEGMPFGTFELDRDGARAESLALPPRRGLIMLDAITPRLRFKACDFDTWQAPPIWDCAPWIDIPVAATPAAATGE